MQLCGWLSHRFALLLLLLQVFAEHQLSKDAAIGNAVISIVQVGRQRL
jgi:hypothetical protein